MCLHLWACGAVRCVYRFEDLGTKVPVNPKPLTWVKLTAFIIYLWSHPGASNSPGSTTILLLRSFKAQQGQEFHTAAMVRKTGTCQGKDPKVTRGSRDLSYIQVLGINTGIWGLGTWMNVERQTNQLKVGGWRGTEYFFHCRKATNEITVLNKICINSA